MSIISYIDKCSFHFCVAAVCYVQALPWERSTRTVSDILWTRLMCNDKDALTATTGTGNAYHNIKNVEYLHSTPRMLCYVYPMQVYISN